MEDRTVRTSLINRLCQGETGQTDWAVLNRDYSERFIQLGKRLGLGWEEASELANDMLVKVFKSISAYNPPSVCTRSFSAWLFKCARNEAIDRLRKRRRQGMGQGGSSWQRRMEDEPAGESTPDCDEEVLCRLFTEEFLPDMIQEAEGMAVLALGEQVVKVVREASETTSWQAFLLCDFQEFPAKDIAPFLGLQPGTVHRAVSRVNQRIREARAKS